MLSYAPTPHSVPHLTRGNSRSGYSLLRDEGVDPVAHLGRVVAQVNHQHIKSALLIPKRRMLVDEPLGDACQLSLLTGCDTLFGFANGMGAPSLDLQKHQSRTVQRDQIQFTLAPSPVLGEQAIALFLEIVYRFLLAPAS